MELDVGSIINDRYQVERLHPTPDKYLSYFLARDLFLQRVVIIKMAAITTHERFMDRFRHEARILASLEHPHIVPIYDYGVHDKHPYQAQRYLSGGKIDDHLGAHRQGLSGSEVMRLAQQLGSALDYIHLHGISHRNVDGANVVLDDQREPYLTNFTLARLRDSFDDVSEDDVARSTQEMLLDKATDLYAFGLLLYRALTGREPNTSYGEKPTSVRHYRPNLPIGVDLALSRLLHEDPQQRYGSARAAVDDLYSAFMGAHASVEGKIFISYARDDSEYVYHLAKQLRDIGLDIWIDQDIPTGANWDDEIENALDACDKLLLIASPSSMISENVQDEWSYFLERGKPVFPFIYKECNLSFRLRRRQYIESTGDLMSDLAKIVDVLAGETPAND